MALAARAAASNAGDRTAPSRSPAVDGGRNLRIDYF
jgi:hypothetical protein